MVILKGTQQQHPFHRHQSDRQVVHGKEIPWNLFTPKAPYQAKARSSPSDGECFCEVMSLTSLRRVHPPPPSPFLLLPPPSSLPPPPPPPRPPTTTTTTTTVTPGVVPAAAATVSLLPQPWSITFQISHVKLHGIAMMPRIRLAHKPCQDCFHADKLQGWLLPSRWCRTRSTLRH